MVGADVARANDAPGSRASGLGRDWGARGTWPATCLGRGARRATVLPRRPPSDASDSMTIAQQSPAPSQDAGPRAVPADRRRRTHLRDLCDEVLASFRLARDRDVVSDGDREAARTVLAQLTPSLGR